MMEEASMDFATGIICVLLNDALSAVLYFSVALPLISRPAWLDTV